MDCRLLTSVTIGAGVDEIADGAFAGHHTFSIYGSCPNGDYDYRVSSGGWVQCIQVSSGIPTVIESLTLGSTLKRIGIFAFAWNSKLTTVTFPSSLAAIGQYAFYENTALTSIDFGTASSLVTIDKYAFMHANLTSVVIPDSVIAIGSYAFVGRQVWSTSVNQFGEYHYVPSSLTSLTLGAGVVSIGDYAFAGASITSLTLPAGSDCRQLTRLDSICDTAIVTYV